MQPTRGQPPEAVDPIGYHYHPALSSTRLKAAVSGTMRAYWARYVDPNRVEVPPTDAMRQGSLVDTFITQPEKAEQRYLVLPADAPKRPTAKQLQDGRNSRPGTKIHDAYLDAQAREKWWEEFFPTIGKREVVTQEWWDRAEAIREVLMAHPEIGPRLRDALVTSQDPHLWFDEGMGEWCRYLPDLETDSGELWDLKKARSCSPRAMVAQAYALAYDLQLSHYDSGYCDRHRGKPTQIGLICYEWDWPHDSILMPASDTLIALGYERRNLARRLIRECEEAGVWPSHETTELTPPRWLMRGEPQPEEPAPTPDPIVLF